MSDVIESAAPAAIESATPIAPAPAPEPVNITAPPIATVDQLEAEREKRLAAGAWSGSERTILMAVVAEGESEEVAQRRALYQYLAKNPEGPQSINAFDWIII